MADAAERQARTLRKARERSDHAQQREPEASAAWSAAAELSVPAAVGTGQTELFGVVRFRVSEKGDNSRRSAESLDTLAQLGLKQPSTPVTQLAADTEKRTGLLPKELMLRRARAKYFSLPIATRLADMRTPLEKSYRNSVYCTAELVDDGTGKVRGSYCGNRWCLVCNRIRTARAINRYKPVVETWDTAHMATVTVRNVSAAELRPMIGRMIKSFQEIKRAVRRYDRVPLIALRKLECTYNAARDDYHPHFHIICTSQTAAAAFVQRWLDHFTGDAEPVAQDVRPCDAGALIEFFKYFTKLVSRKKKRGDGASSVPVPPAALDVIFTAMRGKRVYQPVGFKIATDEPDDEEEKLVVDHGTASPKPRTSRVEWRWHQDSHDWLHVDSDGVVCDTLSDYVPSEPFKRFVESIENAAELNAGVATVPVAAAAANCMHAAPAVAAAPQDGDDEPQLE